jgi:oxalate decarboxylase/phosphoglucose isomerase-like protein (cupin superfamily)
MSPTKETQRTLLTRNQLIECLQKCPEDALVFFYDSPDKEVDDEMNDDLNKYQYHLTSEYSGNVCAVELRKYTTGGSEIHLHGTQPDWQHLGVKVIYEDSLFTITEFDDSETQ